MKIVLLKLGLNLNCNWDAQLNINGATAALRGYNVYYTHNFKTAAW